MLACLSTRGYRGRLVTKSRRFSVTFGALRGCARIWRRHPARLDPDADVCELRAEADPDESETVAVVRFWTVLGLG